MKGEQQTIWGMVCSPERDALLSPARRRACIDHVRNRFKMSERGACRVLGQHRSSRRHAPQGRAAEDHPVADTIELVRQFGHYGYPLAGR